jgi:lipopolysaccharide transport system permease protein
MYSKRQVQLRYRQSALGLAWTLIQPIAIMAIYGFVFTQFLDVSSEGDPYLSMAWSGLTVWMFVQAALQSGVMSLLNDSYMIGKIWFPREIIPLAPVMAGLVDLGTAGIVLVGVVLVQGASIGLNWISLLPIFVVLMVWVSAISVFTATLNIFLRDLATIVGLGLRLMFIATPVMYPASVVPLNLSWVLTMNPFAVIINNVRAVMIGGDWPNWELLALHFVLGSVFLYGALWYLRAVERRMVDVI